MDPPPATDPPPFTAFAWRNGLVRPVEGRLLAGVCGALGRATNTDPILWRVLIAVLSIFGGIGVLAYLLGWLLLPADGDTASPVESLMGRGRSGTSTAMTVIGGGIVLLSLGVFFSEPFRPGPFGILLLGGATLLLLRDKHSRPRPAGVGPASGTTAPAWSAPPPPATYAPAAPFAPRGPFAAPAPPVPPPPPGAYGPQAPPPAFGPPAAPERFGAPATYPGGPYAAPAPGSGQPPQQPPPYRPGPAVAPRPQPRPKSPRSRLGGLTFSVALLAVGALGIIDLAGYSVPTAGYIAAALTTVGLGLVLGTWIGRARGLIALGIILSLVLGMAAVVSGYDRQWWRDSGSITYVPTSLADLRQTYSHSAGAIQLVLTEIDFPAVGPPVAIAAHVSLGELDIIVPRDVDVTVTAKVDIGDAHVFVQSWDGFGMESRTITDLGEDGAGGGELHIDASVDLGSLEVRR